MDRYSPRKKVSQEEQKKNLQKAAIQEVLPGYEEYLVLLQERNRLLKRLRKKSKKQIDNERKEQGFSIYVSGANAEKGRAGRQSPSKHPHHCMSPEPDENEDRHHTRLKTAGDVPRKKLIDHNDLEMIVSEERRKQEEKKRVKTAPARERRRNWMAASVEVKTDRGEKCKIKAPEILTGHYDDDFEDDDSGNEDEDKNQVQQHMSAMVVDKNKSRDVTSAKTYKQSSNIKQRQVPPQRKPPPPPPSDDSESEEENEKLMLSIADIKKLRQSLAMNRSIRESLAKEVSSDEDISDRATPIQEDDIEEDLIPAIDSISLDDPRKKEAPPVFKPTDTVVLELAAPPSKQKVEKNLSAARKKNAEEEVSIPNSRKKYDQATENDRNTSNKSALSMRSDTPSKKRPLSASRVNRKETVDTEAETSAVLEALLAENEQASKLKQDFSRKLPQSTTKQATRPSSAGKVPSSTRKSQEVRPLPKTPSRESIPSSPRRHSVKTPSKESNRSVDGQQEEKSFLLDDRLNDVMKKVLLMQPNQQKKLMKVLGRLDSSTDKEDDKSRPGSSKPVKAVVPVREMVNSVPKGLPPKSVSPEDCTEVNIELLSNWGHKDLLGLTELQFFDKHRQLLPVKKESVTVHGARDQRGGLDILFNGKTKTNKDRYMWCCRYRHGSPVELCVVLPIKSPDIEIARIKIWNYNKSLTELDIGVKHARIFVGGELVFDGDVEKGCGNQVFDYGFTINLKDSDSPRDHGTSSSPPSLSPVIHTRSPVSDRSESHKRASYSLRSPSPSTEQRQTVSSLSQSSNESLHKGQQSSSTKDRSSKGDKPVQTRSETRTLNHSERDLPRPIIQSDRSGSETEDGHSREAFYQERNESLSGVHMEGRRDDYQLPLIPGPRHVVNSPGDQYNYRLRYGQSSVSHIENEEFSPRRRRSWEVCEADNFVPKLYHPDGSPFKDVPRLRFDNPHDVSVRNSGDLSASGSTTNRSRRKKWSTPKMTTVGPILNIKEESPTENQQYNFDRRFPDRDFPNEGVNKVSVSYPNQIGTVRTPVQLSSRAWPQTPTNETERFGLLRTPVGNRGRFPPNKSDRSSGSYIDKIGRANPSHNMNSKLSMGLNSRQRTSDSIAIHVPKNSVSNHTKKTLASSSQPNLYTDLTKRSSASKQSNQSKGNKSQSNSSNSKHVNFAMNNSKQTDDDERPAKYTYTVKESDENNNDPKDDERAAKYTYTKTPKEGKSVTFQEDKKDSKTIKASKKKKKHQTSSVEIYESKFKPGQSKNSSAAVKDNSVKRFSDADQSKGASRRSDQFAYLSPGRRQWSSPVEEYEDPRTFWVDLGEGKEDDSRMPGKPRGSRTPRKSKRMAAKLDGHSSTETDNSKSVGESTEQKPPKPPTKKADDKSGATSAEKATWRTDVRGTENEEQQEEDAMLQSQDDIPMIQKLKEMNQSSKDQKRRKDVPKWLKQEDMSAAPFESPPVSRGGSRQEQRTASEKPPLPLKDHMTQSNQENVDMLIDEELALWQDKEKPLKTVFDEEKTETKDERKTGASSRDGSKTPMQKIQNNRAKWRDTHKKNLEESWGSLNMFDRHQKGRISMDLDDDALDEYLQPSKKPSPQPVIKEENEEGSHVPAKEEPDDEFENFTIPELPYGKELVINIKTTWGDKHYVGLTGIELFSSTGDSVGIAKLTAKPLDINILQDYEKDPRVVTNLIDGVNRTRDDVHMWLAPFTPKGNHYIYLTFERACKIALMRIWNYNKSRIHSYRGAKEIVVTLDGTRIFSGEIARACGGIEGGTEAFGDTILFTTDEDILEAVSRNDDAYEGDMLSDGEPDDVPFQRPSTADGGSDDERPFTRAVGNLKKGEKDTALPPRPATSMVTEGDVIVFKGKNLELNFTETWGDLHYLGLTGLEIVGKDGEALPINLNMITANPKDLHHLPGHERDDRTLDKLIDNTNITTSDEHMWLIPFNSGKNHTFVIAFNQTMLIAGLRVWNYNKSSEDTYRGAKTVHVTIDGKQVSPPEGYLIRKGPGNCHFDFAQEIGFGPQQKSVPTPTAGRSDSVRGSFSSESLEEYESMQMPCGFIYQIQLTSTWGDPYYVGLNGLEIYDASHHKIELTENNISAYPDSINVLASTQNDVRTPDKLIDGVNSTMDGRHMWLAPILPTILNRVYVIFDQPTAVSMIKIWNYSKTPQRGAKDVALLVDDLLVYNGTLLAVRSGAKGILPTCEGQQHYHTIMFTDNKEIIRKEKHSIISNQTGEQDIQLTNDKQVVSHYNDPKKAQQGKPVNQELRPKTSVPGVKKVRR